MRPCARTSCSNCLRRYSRRALKTNHLDPLARLLKHSQLEEFADRMWKIPIVPVVLFSLRCSDCVGGMYLKVLMSGNEAIARGAWEAGARFASAYPGTPSTEILENTARYQEIRSQWSVNEKTALEAALGASLGGARALCAMKHVGLNVAADPLFSSSYTGVNAGLVIVTADDPGCHSSQNEQDNRYYAQAARLPLIEPSDSQEALGFTRMAFELSEEYDTPVLLRVTTRIAHGKSPVTAGERTEATAPAYERTMAKYVLVPAVARPRHAAVEERLARLQAYAESSP